MIGQLYHHFVFDIHPLGGAVRHPNQLLLNHAATRLIFGTTITPGTCLRRITPPLPDFLKFFVSLLLIPKMGRV
jgi:hypothetical protein